VPDSEGNGVEQSTRPLGEVIRDVGKAVAEGQQDLDGDPYDNYRHAAVAARTRTHADAIPVQRGDCRRGVRPLVRRRPDRHGEQKAGGPVPRRHQRGPPLASIPRRGQHDGELSARLVPVPTPPSLGPATVEAGAVGGESEENETETETGDGDESGPENPNDDSGFEPTDAVDDADDETDETDETEPDS
jgi:hypothetical protein